MLVFLAASLLLSCVDYGEYEDFFHLPYDQQRQAIKSYSLEQQVDIFLLAERVPDNASYIFMLSDNGASIVPVLVKRLTAPETDDIDKRSLVYAFALLEAGSDYNVAGDDALMQMLNDAVASIKEDLIRDSATRALDHIREIDDASCCSR